MMHIINSNKKAETRLQMKENWREVDKHFGNFNSKIRPCTNRLQRMIVGPIINPEAPKPSDE